MALLRSHPMAVDSGQGGPDLMHIN